MAKTQEPTSTSPKILSLEAIEAIEDTAVRTVFVPGWGGSVRFKPLLMAEVQQINKMARIEGKTDGQRANALFLSRALVEPKMSFPEAMRLVQTKAGQNIARIINAILDDEEALVEAEAEFRD